MSLKGFEFSKGFWFEILFRVFLAVLFMKLESLEPFERKIHPDELWWYKNPQKKDYVPSWALLSCAFITPMLSIFLIFVIQKNRFDLRQAILCSSLTLGLNGVLVDIIKLITGRPRPDFFWRCFPDGKMNTEFKCTGDPQVVIEGRKSFPSGHCAFAFASFGFITLYLAGKLHTFSLAGKGNTLKLCTFLLPLGIALVVALSRICDYHHHWQDVVMGSLIGFALAYLCYRHYYPPLDSQVCHQPYLIAQT